MKKLTKKQIALREKCIAESDDYFRKEWSKPGFAKSMETFRQEYAMKVAMYQAKRESGQHFAQAELYAHIARAEREVDEGEGLDARESLKRTRARIHV